VPGGHGPLLWRRHRLLKVLRKVLDDVHPRWRDANARALTDGRTPLGVFQRFLVRGRGGPRPPVSPPDTSQRSVPRRRPEVGSKR
jgi:hypothetical protein